MTVLDEVLQAEKDAATKIAEATAAAAQKVADAKKLHTETIEAEKVTLSEAAAKELANHEQTVQKNSKAIVDAAQTSVEAIKSAYAAKSAELTKKITEAIS